MIQACNSRGVVNEHISLKTVECFFKEKTRPGSSIVFPHNESICQQKKKRCILSRAASNPCFPEMLHGYVMHVGWIKPNTLWFN